MGWLRLSHMRRVVELLNMVLVGFSCSVVVLLARMNEPLVADKQVAAREGFGTDLADEGLLLGVSANVPLKVLLYYSCSVSQWPRQIIRFPMRSYQTSKEALAMRARESFGLIARLFSLDPARGRRRQCRVHGGQVGDGDAWTATSTQDVEIRTVRFWDVEGEGLNFCKLRGRSYGKESGENVEGGGAGAAESAAGLVWSGDTRLATE